MSATTTDTDKDKLMPCATFNLQTTTSGGDLNATKVYEMNMNEQYEFDMFETGKNYMYEKKVVLPIDTSVGLFDQYQEQSDKQDICEECTETEISPFSGTFGLRAISSEPNSYINDRDASYQGYDDIDMNISDEDLFKDPPPKEDCPICFLPVPHASGACFVRKTYLPCCGKILCTGCADTTDDEMGKGNMKRCCPFGRVSLPTTLEQKSKRYKKRREVGDAEAIHNLGSQYKEGNSCLQQNFEKALELQLESARLGSIDARNYVANAYWSGEGVATDINRARYHWRLAAMGGHESARHILGILERNNDMNKAMKHFMIAARAGYDKSLKEVGEGYKKRCVNRHDSI